jgi:hypothetical protein
MREDIESLLRYFAIGFQHAGHYIRDIVRDELRNHSARFRCDDPEAFVALPEVKLALVIATLTDSDVQASTTWRMQIGFLHEHIKERRLLTMRDIAALFECNPGSAFTQLTAIDKCGGLTTIKMGRSSFLQLTLTPSHCHPFQTVHIEKILALDRIGLRRTGSTHRVVSISVE